MVMLKFTEVFEVGMWYGSTMETGNRRFCLIFGKKVFELRFLTFGLVWCFPALINPISAVACNPIARRAFFLVLVTRLSGENQQQQQPSNWETQHACKRVYLCWCVFKRFITISLHRHYWYMCMYMVLMEIFAFPRDCIFEMFTLI